jgi:hypothetical protein
MSDTHDPWKPNRKHRRHVYYKLQLYDETSLTWRDLKDAFDVLEEARASLEASRRESRVRIMVVDGPTRYPLEE